MNENMTIDMEKGQDNGQITYANEVISTIVSVATTEVEGISGIAGSAGSISGILGKGKFTIRKITRSSSRKAWGSTGAAENMRPF